MSTHLTRQAKQELEAYVANVESTLQSPEMGSRLKRGQRAAVESELARAMEKLEVRSSLASPPLTRQLDSSTGEELKKANLLLKRAMQKAVAGASR